MPKDICIQRKHAAHWSCITKWVPPVFALLFTLEWLLKLGKATFLYIHWLADIIDEIVQQVPKDTKTVQDQQLSPHRTCWITVLHKMQQKHGHAQAISQPRQLCKRRNTVARPTLAVYLYATILLWQVSKLVQGTIQSMCKVQTNNIFRTTETTPTSFSKTGALDLQRTRVNAGFHLLYQHQSLLVAFAGHCKH